MIAFEDSRGERIMLNAACGEPVMCAVHVHVHVHVVHAHALATRWQICGAFVLDASTVEGINLNPKPCARCINR